MKYRIVPQDPQQRRVTLAYLLDFNVSFEYMWNRFLQHTLTGYGLETVDYYAATKQLYLKYRTGEVVWARVEQPVEDFSEDACFTYSEFPEEEACSPRLWYRVTSSYYGEPDNPYFLQAPHMGAATGYVRPDLGFTWNRVANARSLVLFSGRTVRTAWVYGADEDFRGWVSAQVRFNPEHKPDGFLGDITQERPFVGLLP